MRKTDKLTPVLFDDKDIQVDDKLWEGLFDTEENIPYCVSNNCYTALFFLPTMEGDRAYKAHILSYQWSEIEVTCLQDNGTIWAEDVEKLKELFTIDNICEDNDIYVQCISTQDKDGRYTSLLFKFFHTDK